MGFLPRDLWLGDGDGILQNDGYHEMAFRSGGVLA
jgi:hypothetical protein